MPVSGGGNSKKITFSGGDLEQEKSAVSLKSAEDVFREQNPDAGRERAKFATPIVKFDDLKVTYSDDSLTQDEIDKFDVKPLLSRVVVKEVDISKIGALYIPEGSQELRVTEGWVVAIGDEVTLVKPGDSVYYGLYSGAQISRNRRKYRMMNEQDLLGLIVSPEEVQEDG